MPRVIPFLAAFIWLASSAHGAGQSGDHGWRAASGASAFSDPPLGSAPRSSAASIRPASGESQPGGELSADQGQVWTVYDLRPFTDRFPQEPKPEQAVVDWILRETGTETWFSEVSAVLNASRTTLRAYHTPEIQQIVADVVDRFVRPGTSDYQYSVHMVTIANPNWRSKALPRLQSVSVQTPGAEAWIMSRENAAVVVADLRKRADYREHNSPNLLIPNGQSHQISNRRPLAYIKSVQGITGGPGGHRLETGQVEEGFTIALSPLLSSDSRTVDAVIRLETAQVERLTPVAIPVPTPSQPRQSTQIQVPQTCSWRIHERFRWPVDQVLLISCGVVAIPDSETSPLRSLPVIGNRPPRADALLFVEAKGGATSLAEPTVQSARAAGSWNYRNRY